MSISMPCVRSDDLVQDVDVGAGRVGDLLEEPCDDGLVAVRLIDQRLLHLVALPHVSVRQIDRLPHRALLLVGRRFPSPARRV